MVADDMQRRARLWVERTCAEQGVPVKVSDPAVLDYVASILIEAREKRAQA